MFPTVAGSMTNLAAAINQSKVQEDNSGGGETFLQFSGQTGIYKYGREAEDVAGELIVINTATLKHGWALWVNKAITKELVPFTQELPMAMEPQQDARGKMQYPAEARSIEAAFLDDGDDVISFTTNSLGGRKCLDTVFSAIKVRASGGEENFLFPVVKLDSTSYEGQNGTVFNPIFEIVDWMDMEGKRESDTAKLTSEPEVEEAQPTRTRRKRSA